MSISVVLRRDAKLDLDRAYRYYESEYSGLGSEFLDAVADRIDSISEYPQSFPAVYQEVREALVKRFP